MKMVTIFKITNHSERNVFLWTKDEKLRKIWRGTIVKSGCYVIIDLMMYEYQLNLDECFFQFIGTKRKIKIDNVRKYDVELQYV